jgi:hypothetical protein
MNAFRITTPGLMMLHALTLMHTEPCECSNPKEHFTWQTLVWWVAGRAYITFAAPMLARGCPTATGAVVVYKSFIPE